MEIKVNKKDGDIFLLELSGSLDLYSSNQLKEQIMKIIESRVEGIILNLIDIGNINSTGIGALIYAASTLRKLNCPMVIVAPKGPLINILEISRLKPYFTVAASVDAALAIVKPK